jgi:dTMP kinase
MLIAIEGIDGSGKSTQVKLFPADYKLAFPRYNYFFGKIIKLILHHEWGKKLSPYLVAGFFALDRLMAKKTINGYLEAGKTVLLDRYTGSSQAHQGVKVSGRKRQKLIAWIDWLENRLFQLPTADKVFFLNLPPTVSKRLMLSRQKDAAEKDFAYQQKAYQLYCQLAKRKKWQIINCVKKGKLLTPKEIHEQIRSRLN